MNNLINYVSNYLNCSQPRAIRWRGVRSATSRSTFDAVKLLETKRYGGKGTVGGC